MGLEHTTSTWRVRGVTHCHTWPLFECNANGDPSPNYLQLIWHVFLEKLNYFATSNIIFVNSMSRVVSLICIVTRIIDWYILSVY